MADGEAAEKASGDAGSQEKIVTPSPPPPPPVVPDVELIVDGFGFMPKKRRRLSKAGKMSDGALEEHVMEEHEPVKDPCGSSTNIDIVRRYTWKTKNRMTVQVISYGATITCIQVPDRKGVPDDVIAGFDTLEEYLQPRNPYFGATIGRYANIIREGTMCVKPSGRMYMLSTNYKNRHHYHGGFVGFDKVNWRSYVKDKTVIMSHVSERFDEGYPGTVMAQVTFEVTCDNSIKIEMKCVTTEPTIVNMTNVQYFNLGGHHSGPENVYEHLITINADKYTPTDDDDGMVTGEKKVVGGTAFDFRIPRVLSTMITKMPFGGYDVNYCITQGTEQDLTFQARALHPVTGRVVEIYSNQPGMQFYTGNLLPDPDRIVEPLPDGGEEETKPEGEMEEEEEEEELSTSDEQVTEDGSKGTVGYGYVPLMGKSGTFYKKHGLFCMTPQNYPDAVNHKRFPNSTLNPGEVYCHKIQYKFGLLLGRYV